MKRVWREFLGALAFFLISAGVVTIALTVYGAVEGRERGIVAAIMLAVVVLLALFMTAVDFIRRRLFEERYVERILEATDRIAKGDFRPLDPRLLGSFTEYDRILDNLNRMAAELGESEMMKSDFISNVSHELKTPLAVIRGYCAALAGTTDEERRAAYLSEIAAACDRLTRLVSDVLTLTKLERGGILPEMTRFDLGEQLREVALTFEESIEKKQLRFELEADDATICSYAGYLETVWRNLLSNAIKFTPAGGAIFVRAKAEEGSVRVSVRDTGCGIPSETGGRIFEKFYQGDPSHAQEGNGLGLALVKRIVDLVGGEIGVESRVGEGSEFTVTLRVQA